MRRWMMRYTGTLALGIALAATVTLQAEESEQGFIPM